MGRSIDPVQSQASLAHNNEAMNVTARGLDLMYRYRSPTLAKACAPSRAILAGLADYRDGCAGWHLRRIWRAASQHSYS